eukprot:3941032-Rhodomonas_salina.2
MEGGGLNWGITVANLRQTWTNLVFDSAGDSSTTASTTVLFLAGCTSVVASTLVFSTTYSTGTTRWYEQSTGS